MSNTFFFPGDIISRRFAVGHTRHDDGRITIARPWAMARGNAPAGGMGANQRDQITWAKFHLGDGTAADGTRLLTEENLRRMQEPTVEMAGSALGDAVGISWLLGEVGGVRTVSHGGTTNGQYSKFRLVPDRGFGFISMTNCGPNGPELNRELIEWALRHYLGLAEPEPEPLRLSDAAAAYVGRFETITATLDLTAQAAG